MEVIKLNSSHIDMIEDLFFSHDKYMQGKLSSNSEFDTFGVRQNQYDMFCSSYLNNLPNHHAYGIIENDEVKSYISFYESVEEPSWYCTMLRNNSELSVKPLLDAAIRHNEKRNRLKFYTLMNARHSHNKIMRRFLFSDWARERYDYFDEYIVKRQTRSPYNHHFEILFNRSLMTVDTVVRCTFLKEKYRYDKENTS